MKNAATPTTNAAFGNPNVCKMHPTKTYIAVAISIIVANSGYLSSLPDAFNHCKTPANISRHNVVIIVSIFLAESFAMYYTSFGLFLSSRLRLLDKEISVAKMLLIDSSDLCDRSLSYSVLDVVFLAILLVAVTLLDHKVEFLPMVVNSPNYTRTEV